MPVSFTRRTALAILLAATPALAWAFPDKPVTLVIPFSAGGSTDVVVNTDLTIKGKVAQFGRGMIADVSGKLMTEFVDCLEGKLDAPAPARSASSTLAGNGAEGGGSSSRPSQRCGSASTWPTMAA